LNGSHTFRVRAKDAASNTDTTPATRIWTIDMTPPAVTDTTPANLATGVLPAANVTATFSEPMSAATINPTNVKIRKNGTTTFLSATLTYDAANKRAVLNPNANLQAGATYIVTVGIGAKDVAGNALDQNPSLAGSQPKTWRFTVRK